MTALLATALHSTAPGSVIAVARPERPTRRLRALRAVASVAEPVEAPVAEPVAPPTLFDISAEYDAHAPALFGFAINALRDRGLAEDCVQETFLRAWRSRERFDSNRASSRTWLFAIERNVIIDLQRAQQRSPRVGEEIEDAPADTVDPLETLGLVESLAKLSDEHRDVVVAIHVKGESYADASARLGVPVATLRTRAFYALRALREHLNGKESGDV